MKTFAAMVLLVALPGLSVRAAETFLRAGDIAWASFTNMQRSFGSSSAWTINHGMDELVAGDRYRVSFFENSTNEPPVYQFTLGTSSTNGLSGFFILGQTTNGFFQDKQGVAMLEMLSGTLSIEYIHVTTRIDGSYYFAVMENFSVVPEPSVLWLMGVALVALSLCLRRPGKKSAPDKACACGERRSVG